MPISDKVEKLDPPSWAWKFIAIILSVVLAYLMITKEPLHYEGYIQFGEKSPGTSEFVLTQGVVLEDDSADKMFYPAADCKIGRISSAINVDYSKNRQASVCTCIDAENGVGWYCWH